ncbi:MAG TPA: hypothetical protein VE615_05965 [Gaiellaceae bacterium]|nr:hypothetical protein [Gaiellaceae bacterium]
MAMMVLLVGDADGEFCLREKLVSELARLGVTNIALVRDDETLGVVLEGWSFDPARSARDVTRMVAAPAGARTLHPVMHLAVSNAADEGGSDVRDTAIARA